MISLTSEFDVKKSLKRNTCEGAGYVKPLQLALVCHGSTATYWLYARKSHRDVEPVRKPAGRFIGRRRFELLDCFWKIKDSVFGCVGGARDGQ